MTAAFLSYLEIMSALPEEEYRENFAQATALARSASRHIKNAMEIERALAAHLAFNKLTWTAIGDSYGSTERGVSNTVESWPSYAKSEGEGDDGGWSVEPRR